MPLHHWPNPRVPWRSFHNHWVVRLVEYLNRGVLPEGFRARPTELIVGVESGQLWASSYCSIPGDAPHPQIIVREWAEELKIGNSLPALPLFLQRDQLWVSVNLDQTYQETLEAGRYEPI